MKIKILGALLFFTLLFVFFTNKKEPQSIKKQKTKIIDVLRSNIYAPPSHLDPAKISDTASYFIAQQINRGLVQLDISGHIRPSIADHWNISDDRKTYTFHLKKGVQFHNGREVIAQDFLYSFKRILDPKTKSPVAYYFEKVEGFTVMDKYTFEIKMSDPYTPIIKVLSTPSMAVLPREAVESKESFFDKQPIGAGPFIYDRYDENEQKVILKANENYFEGTPRIKRIECSVLQDEEAYYRFLAGDLDYFKIINMKYAEQLIEKRYPVKKSINHSIAFLGINHKRYPLNHKHISQALFYAINLQEYQDKISKFNFEAADEFLPRASFGRIDTSLHNQFNLDRAQFLMNMNERSSLLKNFNPLKLVKYELQKNTTEDKFFRESFEKIGIKLDILNATRDEYQKILKTKDFDLLYVRYVPTINDPHNILSFFHSKSSFNFFNYKNSTVDYLLDIGQTIGNFEKRSKVYQQLSQVIYEDVSAIPLYYWDELQVFQPQFEIGEYRYVAHEDIYSFSKL